MDTSQLDEWLPGAGESFTDIFNAYYKRLCFYAIQFVPDQQTAEDIVQDCFVKLWKARTRLIVKTTLSTLLYNMVRNGVYDYLHSRYRRTHMNGLEQVTGSQALSEVIAAESMQGVVALANQLPDRNREIFRLLFIEGLDHSEAAECLNIPESTLRTRKARVLSLLRQYATRTLLLFSYFF